MGGFLLSKKNKKFLLKKSTFRDILYVVWLFADQMRRECHSMTDVKKRIEELRSILHYHSRKYYLEDAPEISDVEYDKLFYELVKLEEENPEYYDSHSPTVRVGGKPSEKFEKIKHTVPLKSFELSRKS